MMSNDENEMRWPFGKVFTLDGPEREYTEEEVKCQEMLLDGIRESFRSEVRKDVLKGILKEIRDSNEKEGCIMGEDEDNGRLRTILRNYGLDDDEETIEVMFGVNGLHAIRDAENGFY